MQSSAILPRDGWGARPPTRKPVKRRLDRVAVVSHHFTGGSPRKACEPHQAGRRVESWHMDGNGWSGPAYGFLYARQGVAVELRGLLWDTFAEGRLQGKPGDGRLRGDGAVIPFYTGRLPVARRRPDLIVIPVLWWIGGDQEPTVEQVELAVAMHGWIEARVGHECFVDVHGSHRLKGANPCPGVHVASLAEAGRLGGEPLCTGLLMADERPMQPEPKTKAAAKPKLSLASLDKRLSAIEDQIAK